MEYRDKAEYRDNPYVGHLREGQIHWSDGEIWTKASLLQNMAGELNDFARCSGSCGRILYTKEFCLFVACFSFVTAVVMIILAVTGVVTEGTCEGTEGCRRGRRYR